MIKYKIEGIYVWVFYQNSVTLAFNLIWYGLLLVYLMNDHKFFFICSTVWLPVW